MKAILLTAMLFSCALLKGGTLPRVENTRPSDWDFSIGADSGWSHDHFQWTIAGDLSGQNPNVLSDLNWTNLNIVSAQGTAEITFRKDWHLRLGGSYGWIVSGRNRDSDYDFDNRAGEFSRSTATTRGSVVGAEATLGLDWKISPNVVLTPGLGFVYHRIRVNDRDGVQVIDTEPYNLGPFGGLDSEYAANWWGPSFSLDGKVRLGEKWRLLAGARFELLNYQATGRWNLRRDFVNFRDSADGTGWLLTTGIEWDVTPRWTLSLLGEYGYRKTGSGTQKTLLNDGTHDLNRFNRATWESVGVKMQAVYRF